MAIRRIPVLTSEGEPIYTSDGEQVVLAETEEYEPTQEKQWRLYRFDFKPREEETA
jgi:hypothetical protein